MIRDKQLICSTRYNKFYWLDGNIYAINNKSQNMYYVCNNKDWKHLKGKKIMINKKVIHDLQEVGLDYALETRTRTIMFLDNKSEEEAKKEAMTSIENESGIFLLYPY